MKKWIFSVIAVLFVIGMTVGVANATPKFVPAIPVCDASGNVTIPPLPPGCKLVEVEIYDDARGVSGKPIGAKHNFKLLPGQGFNFMYQDKEGVWYQMITPQSPPPGGGLVIDCSHPMGCKYLFPIR